MHVKFSRQPVCMGDDVDNSVYEIRLPFGATLADLIDACLHRGRGNDWPVPNMGTWYFKTNVGTLAMARYVEGHGWEIEYRNAAPKDSVRGLRIRWIYADRDEVNPYDDGLPNLFQ